jgi:hypothetical protein
MEQETSDRLSKLPNSELLTGVSMSTGGTLQICRDMRDQRHKSETYMSWTARCEANKKAGKKQLKCGACGLWCWPEDRCGAFRVETRPSQT